jgi:hypothetical protein
VIIIPPFCIYNTSQFYRDKNGPKIIIILKGRRDLGAGVKDFVTTVINP